jgi:putative ABC transport system permease protein
VVQFAVCLVLPVGAGLFVRSLGHAETLALGFDAGHLLYVDADLATQGYDAPRAAAFVDALTARAHRLPGVESVSVASFPPLAMIVRVTRVSLPRRDPSAENERVTVRFNMISPDYFTTLRIPLVRGRTFTPAEAQYGAPVAVISDVIARKLWPAEDPIGKTLTIGDAKPAPGDDAPFVPSAQIIGVVRDAKAGMLWETQQSYLYLPMQPQALGRRVTLLVRTARDPGALAPTITQEIRTLDDRLFCSVHPLETLLGLWLLPSRITTMIALVLGSTALLLALVGIYGVMAYAVTDRVREIGIRMALGAQRRDVLELIIGHGMRLVVAGMIAGLLLALVATRSIARFLYGISPLDPTTLIITSAFLATVALVACYVPARRAMRIDPLAALRYD